MSDYHFFTKNPLLLKGNYVGLLLKYAINICSAMPLDPTVFVKEKTGIRFTEKMVGKYTPSNGKTDVRCEFTLTIESDDVERMINCDPDHAAKLSGTVICLALSSSPMSVSEGMFVKCALH